MKIELLVTLDTITKEGAGGVAEAALAFIEAAIEEAWPSKPVGLCSFTVEEIDQ